jgi:hypothetical protein
VLNWRDGCIQKLMAAPSKMKPLPISVVKVGISAKKDQPNAAAKRICT